jgi:hypothetical protein
LRVKDVSRNRIEHTSQIEEVVVLKTADGLELSADVKVLGDAEEVLDTGMCVVVTAKDQLGLLNPGLRASC